MPPVDRRRYACCRARVDHPDVYHILASERYRQDSAIDAEHQPLPPGAFFVAPHAPRLIELAVAIFARIGGVEQKFERAFSRRVDDPFGARGDRRGARLEPQPFERGARQRVFDPRAKIVGHRDIRRFERPRKRALQLALGHRRIERGAIDADPCPASRRLGANVGMHGAIGREREPDQFRTLALGAREDAGPLGRVPLPLAGGVRGGNVRMGEGIVGDLVPTPGPSRKREGGRRRYFSLFIGECPQQRPPQLQQRRRHQTSPPPGALP